MALVRERSPDELCLNLLHDSDSPGDVLGQSDIQSSFLSPALDYDAGQLKDGLIDKRASSDTNSEVTRSPKSHATNLCAPHGFNSAGVILQDNTSSHAVSNKPVINFKHGYSNFLQSSAGALLSFQQNEQDEQLAWEGNLNNIYQWTNYSPRSSDGSDPSLIENFSCLQKTGELNTMFNVGKERQTSDGSCNWFYSEASAITDNNHDSGTHEPSNRKRAFMGYSTDASKKQCLGTNKKAKPKSSATKDPQSIAAKNRRERISERLKMLQELVPNGSKVDLVTMLEKAISYVKFLQLQVKILATDEFWPVQGGKAPDISQVKEAIDAILSSQRDRNSSSSKS